MTHFKPHQKEFQALIFSDSRVEVRQATSDHIEGCVYFTCGTKAFKVATELLKLGLIAPKRKGVMITAKGYIDIKTSYYLGAVILKERDKSGLEYKDEVAKSKMIHEVCYARS